MMMPILEKIFRKSKDLSSVFGVQNSDGKTKARAGVLHTAHGDVETPVFMPVGTNATVKTLSCEDLLEMDTQIILANTYHLFLRPGLEIIKDAGGLHRFMSWERPILTDSGGYQVFSLAKFRKITDEGVKFQSHLDGTPYFFTPEEVMKIEGALGVDVIMPLDECVGHPCTKKEAEKAVVRTSAWAKRARKFFLNSPQQEKQHLFGIVQGSTFHDLRKRSAEELVSIGFDGYAIGGLSVGEPIDLMHEMLDTVEPFLPQESPRYLMGLGTPDQIVKAVGQGVDMFDCCIPTRYGRYGTAFTAQGRLIIRNGEYATDKRPLDKHCGCFVCKRYTRSYIRHLFNAHEVLGLNLVSYHNVYFYLQMMKNIRRAIQENRYGEFEREFLACYNSTS